MREASSRFLCEDSASFPCESLPREPKLACTRGDSRSQPAAVFPLMLVHRRSFGLFRPRPWGSTTGPNGVPPAREAIIPYASLPAPLLSSRPCQPIVSQTLSHLSIQRERVVFGLNENENRRFRFASPLIGSLLQLDFFILMGSSSTFAPQPGLTRPVACAREQCVVCSRPCFLLLYYLHSHFPIS